MAFPYSFSLEGQHVAVAGGSGLIGGAIVRACADLGATVTLLDLHEPKEPLGQARFIPFNVGDFAKPSETIRRLEEKTSPIDAWINSAYPHTATYCTPEAEAADAVESWRAEIDLQLNSACIWNTAVAEFMANRNGGVILAVSSIYGVVAPDFSSYSESVGTPAIYAAAKGGLIAHTRFLSSRFAPKVRANVICPGGVFRNQPEDFLKRYAARTCSGRLAKPEEIGAPAAFLVSKAASYITGAVLMVDGGLTAL